MESTSDEMNAEDLAWMDKMAMEEDHVDMELSALRDRFITVHNNKESFNHNEFSKWLIEESGEHFATIRNDGHIYIYKDGVYVPNGETYIKSKLDEIMQGEFVTSHVKKEVIGHVSDRTYVDVDVFDADENILNLANGLYDFAHDTFRAHTHKHMSLCKSAVIYDPDAKCPNIDAFIDGAVEPHRVPTVYEIGGYALMPRKTIKRGFILLGEPDTGKTQFINLMVKFVGKALTSTVNPIALARNTHTGADLYGKLLNVIDDLGDAPLAETGLIKSIIGEGMITCNQKNRVAFSFTPNVVNVWGCNVLPKTDDPCFGDKFDILLFKNVYGGHPKPDRKLIDKMTTDEELSGFFNKSIAAYREVDKEGQFTGSRSQTHRQMDWTLYSCPTAMFVSEQCSLVDEKALLPKDVFHKLYDLWVKDIGTKREMKKEIKSYLESIGVYSIKQPKRAEPFFNRWCYLGISLLKDEMYPKSSEHDKDGLAEVRSKNIENDEFSEHATVGGFYPTVPTFNPIMSKTINDRKNIVSSTMGSKVGTVPPNQDAETRSINNPDKKISGTTRIEREPNDPDIDSKLKHAVGKAITQSDTIGAELSKIVECYPGNLSMSDVLLLLEERGESLGITERYNKWYVS
jgi:putative DNA primase/helicase